MAEIVGNKIVVDGIVVGTVHEYISSERRVVIGGDNNEK